ncbi:PilZ domain-containing protein [Croceicoccus naphthovorans]|nr:PilZ domain-containing protein [Croceicoccus naphthovorans]MBB3990529.1 hypothetical protein [Croceicoccus naphthovorans]
MTYRTDPRSPVAIPAEYRLDDGEEVETSVIDLSETGCRMRAGVGYLKPGTGLSLAIGNMAPVSAYVRWQYGTYFGVAFTRPMERQLVDYLRHVHARGPLTRH